MTYPRRFKMPTPANNKCTTCKEEFKWSLAIKNGKKQYTTECKCGKKERKAWEPIPVNHKSANGWVQALAQKSETPNNEGNS